MPSFQATGQSAGRNCRNQAAVPTQFTASVRNLPHQYMTPDCLLRISKISQYFIRIETIWSIIASTETGRPLQQITTKTFSHITRQPLCVSGQQRFCTRPSARIMTHQKVHISIRTGRYGHVDGQRKSDHRPSSGSHVMTS